MLINRVTKKMSFHRRTSRSSPHRFLYVTTPPKKSAAISVLQPSETRLGSIAYDKTVMMGKSDPRNVAEKMNHPLFGVSNRYMEQEYHGQREKRRGPRDGPRDGARECVERRGRLPN